MEILLGVAELRGELRASLQALNELVDRLLALQEKVDANAQAIAKMKTIWTFVAAGIALAASAHIIMAVGILMVRDIYRETSIVWVTGYRFLVASLVMILWAAIKYPKSLRKQLFIGFYRPDTWRTMIPMAVLGPFLATLCWVGGFKYLTAGRAAIYNQLSTVFIIVLAYLFLKERFTIRKAIGTVLALLGSILVAMH